LRKKAWSKAAGPVQALLFSTLHLVTRVLGKVDKGLQKFFPPVAFPSGPTRLVVELGDLVLCPAGTFPLVAKKLRRRLKKLHYL
jgi:hypothetical protein